MPISNHFIHRCNTQRAEQTLDAYQNAVATWRDVNVEVPCRLVAKAQQVYSDVQAQFFTLTTYTVLLPAGTDILPEDRVTDVVLEDGTTDAGPFSVNAVLVRRGRAAHHVSVSVTR